VQCGRIQKLDALTSARRVPMILSNGEILEEVRSGALLIDPFDQKYLEPASYDMRVGKDAATVTKDGDPMVDLEKAGFLLVAPYAPAVIYAMEHLRLPLDIAGRFGLKSNLSRRGVYASVGPQVDPGFDGKLSVTLFNLTPSSVALNYGDTFLSLELHRLGKPATKGYKGDYQGRSTFTANEIEPVLGYKGHGLSEAVAGFSELRQSLGKVAGLSEKFDNFLESYEKQNRELGEFNRALLTEMKKLIEHIVGERPTTVVLRAIPRSQAKDEILALFKKSRKTLFYSDLAEQLNLDLELVVELCNELEGEGCIGVLTSHETKRPKAKRG
jgi:dCTP deaminase